jgi:hypothetical protein
MAKTKKEKIIEKRQLQELALKNELLKRLKEMLNLEKDSWIRLSPSSLSLGVMRDEERTLFASEVEFFNSKNFNEDKDELTINFASSGSFKPKDRAPFVRTKHAMEFLNNWEDSTELILKFMKQLKNLQKTWEFENEELNIFQ